MRFTLNRDFYYCFGCGATGDVIDFVSRLYGLSAFDAAKKIASDFGLDPGKPPSAAALVKPGHPMISAFREDGCPTFHVTHLNIAKTKRKCGIIEAFKAFQMI